MKKPRVPEMTEEQREKYWAERLRQDEEQRKQDLAEARANGIPPNAMGLGSLVEEIASRAAQAETRMQDHWFDLTSNRNRIDVLVEELNRRDRVGIEGPS